MNTIEILTVILLISSSILCLTLIYFIYRITKSVYSISLNIEEFSLRLDPLIESTLELSAKLNHITSEADSRLQLSKSILGDIREHADIIINMETKILHGIENSVIHLVQNFQSLGKGVISFWRNYRSK